MDNFFYYLNSKLLHVHKFQNSLDYYGSFLGIQKHFKFNIADDLEYLLQSDHFNETNNIKYVFDYSDHSYVNFGSRTVDVFWRLHSDVLLPNQVNDLRQFGLRNFKFFHF